MITPVWARDVSRDELAERIRLLEADRWLGRLDLDMVFEVLLAALDVGQDEAARKRYDIHERYTEMEGEISDMQDTLAQLDHDIDELSDKIENRDDEEGRKEVGRLRAKSNDIALDLNMLRYDL